MKVTLQRKRDRIDPMYWSVLSVLEMILSGGKLYHCSFCRIQFFDRRHHVSDPSRSVS